MILIYGKGHYENYRAALRCVGLDSVEAETADTHFAFDGLLLPGGGDIKDTLDREETGLIEYCVSKHCPILGICRGMQALNVYFGGTLYDHIPGHQIPGGDLLHATRAGEPLLHRIGACPTVNSNHHQAVRIPGKGLRICQWAADGVAEAIYHPNLPILGVQWHPERMGTAGEPVFRWLKGEVARERRAGTESGIGLSRGE